MLGQSALAGTASSSANSRIFVYEVEGLQQNDQTENNRYPVRNSSTILLQVPYNRMNQEMRRISRLGGKIVSIRALAEATASET
ncbi:MAG TPA: phycobilisome linker polypeptide [Coleofasciculaceae cyanobacterium]